MDSGPIGFRVWCVFLEAHFMEKRALCLLVPPKQITVLTVSVETFFSKLRALDYVQQSYPTSV